MEHPLADRIRPQSLDEVVGQKHLLGGNALLRRFIEKGTDANMVFYGPSGTGKTTIANIIAKRTHRTLYMNMRMVTFFAPCSLAQPIMPPTISVA